MDTLRRPAGLDESSGDEHSGASWGDSLLFERPNGAKAHSRLYARNRLKQRLLSRLKAPREPDLSSLLMYEDQRLRGILMESKAAPARQASRSQRPVGIAAP